MINSAHYAATIWLQEVSISIYDTNFGNNTVNTFAGVIGGTSNLCRVRNNYNSNSNF